MKTLKIAFFQTLGILLVGTLMGTVSHIIHSLARS